MGKFNKKILSFVAVGAFSSLLISCSETPQTSEKETVQNTLSQTGAVSDNTANLSENTTSGVATVITEIPETSADTVQTTIQSEITTVTDQTTITPTVPNETQATEATTVTEKQNENNAPSFDIDDSVIVTVNQDGSFHVKFQEADCSITLPAHWAEKFVIRNNTVYAKKAFYNGFDDGKLFSVYFSDELMTSGSPFKCRGKASGKYCYIIHPTDCRADTTNKDEMDEYSMMVTDSYDFVYDSLVCEPLDIVLPDEVNPVLYGEISSGGREIEGYTTSYVCEGKEKSVQWICEDTWHITAYNTVYSHGVQWYECWDTDDGDYYGWIDGSFLTFYDYSDIDVSISDYLGSWSEVTGVRVFIDVYQLDDQNVGISVHGSGGASISYDREYIGSLSGDGTIYFSGVSYTKIYNDDGTYYIEDYVEDVTGRMRIGKTGLLSLTVDGSDEYQDEYFEKR